jgi:2-hydroxy-3-keto-5-methylthiopentenyl-1-phosphate phosphatase
MLIQCDFDGTVTEEDIGFILLDTYADPAWRKVLEQYRRGKVSVGYFNSRAFSMIGKDEETLVEAVRKRAKLRSRFAELVAYARYRGFRFVVVSNGLDFYIKTILSDAGLGDIEVHAAKTEFLEDGLRVQYIGPDGTPLDTDFKESYIKDFVRQGHQVVYVGNGISDLAPAAHAHRIFATGELIDLCRRDGMDFLPFDDFRDVIRGLDNL